MTCRLSFCLLFLALAATPAQAHHPPGAEPGEIIHRIFATSFSEFKIGDSGEFPPAVDEFFGSLQDADWYVNKAASDAGLIKPPWNGLDLIYTAIISDSDDNAIDRFTVSVPIYNTNNELIANDAADLWDGSIANPIAYDEFGVEITSSPEVWTGTKTDGDSEGTDCNDWKDNFTLATVGRVTASNSHWVDQGLLTCQVARLYGISPAETVPDSADFDGNDLVDGGDFLTWQRNFGTTGPPPPPHANGNANGDDFINDADLAIWESQYGDSPPLVAIAATSAAVPEPTTSALALAALCLAMSRRRSF